MSLSSIFPILQTLFALQILYYVEAGKNDLECDVCRAVVREANWKISLVDPKKFIQVGSFRVDPDGNQNIKEKKYARSESHVEDIFESICDRLRDYAELANEDGTKEIVRYIGIDGTRLNTKDYNLNKDIGKKMVYKCENFLENHEEIVMSLLQRENLDNYENIICGEETGVCSGNELSRPVTELPEAQDEDPEEPEDEGEDESDAGEEEESSSAENETEEEPMNSIEKEEKDEL